MGLVVFPVTEIAQDARLHLLSRAHIKNNFDYFITVSNPLQIKKKRSSIVFICKSRGKKTHFPKAALELELRHSWDRDMTTPKWTKDLISIYHNLWYHLFWTGWKAFLLDFSTVHKYSSEAAEKKPGQEYHRLAAQRWEQLDFEGKMHFRYA